MSLFARAFDSGWLSGMVQAAAGNTVTYRRGSTSITVPAVLGQTVFSSTAEGGPRIEFGDRDYLIEVTDLTFGEPRVGDRVTDAAGLVFELQTPDTGEPAWRYSGPDRTTYRLHVKRVG